MARNRGLRLFALAAAVFCGAILQASPVSAAPLVDETLPGPIGGAEICVGGLVCQELAGVDNVRIVVDLDPGTVTPPAVFTGSAPGCTSNINLALFVTTPGLSGGSVISTVTYNFTDKNGNVIQQPQVLTTGPIALPPTAGTTIPVASVCGRLL